MNPAALLAAIKGDVENTIAANMPGGIERQEAAGQQAMIASEMLPRDVHNATREQMEALGFKFGADVDELFIQCQLPAGWSKRATEHSMHSDLLDDKGRGRAGIFYKAAFYDRRADMYFKRRFEIESWRDGSAPETRRIDVTDCGVVIKGFGEAAARIWADIEAKEKDAKDWLAAGYPDWLNVHAYWD